MPQTTMARAHVALSYSKLAREIRTDTILTVETLAYALHENELLWAGQIKTTNPKNVKRVIEDTAEKVASELEQIGLMARSY